ncbi:MAG: hypothetical protein HXS54_00675 [Theionarchaea archaeon]|nr:hypothetical protein [Theionarchaea archaeon]
METIELIRVASYVINAVACFVLSVYFLRDFFTKRLRASLAWGIGFLLFGLVVLNLILLSTAELSKSAVYFGFLLTSVMVFCLYYGASLLFFNERSFFREKMAIIYCLATLFIGLILTYLTPTEKIVETMRTPTTAMYGILYIVITILFYQVSRRIPEGDPRRRTIGLVSLSWAIIAFWNFYIAFAWLERPSIEAGIFLLGSFGFLLLLYGMTTGKTTRK